MHALRICRHYLLGRRFELRIDHISLKHIFEHPTLNARQAKWMDFLSEFDFELKHIEGKENKVLDALSQKDTHRNHKFI